MLGAVCNLRTKVLATKKGSMSRSDSPMNKTVLNLHLVITALIEEVILF